MASPPLISLDFLDQITQPLGDDEDAKCAPRGAVSNAEGCSANSSATSCGSLHVTSVASDPCVVPHAAPEREPPQPVPGGFCVPPAPLANGGDWVDVSQLKVLGHLTSRVERSPPCGHNNWDNLRAKNSVVTLCCRDCQQKWKQVFPIADLCPEFHQSATCAFGPHCPMLHVHRFKSVLKSPNPPGYVPGTVADALFSQCARDVLARHHHRTLPREIVGEVIALYQRLCESGAQGAGNSSAAQPLLKTTTPAGQRSWGAPPPLPVPSFTQPAPLPLRNRLAAGPSMLPPYMGSQRQVVLVPSPQQQQFHMGPCAFEASPLQAAAQPQTFMVVPNNATCFIIQHGALPFASNGASMGIAVPDASMMGACFVMDPMAGAGFLGHLPMGAT